MNAEEKVRAAWKRVRYSETGLTDAGPCYVTISLEDHPTAGTVIFMHHGRSKEECFSAAEAFTDDRLKQVAEIEEEIEFLQNRVRPHWPSENDVPWVVADASRLDRILKREQAALTELRRGMK